MFISVGEHPFQYVLMLTPAGMKRILSKIPREHQFNGMNFSNLYLPEQECFLDRTRIPLFYVLKITEMIVSMLRSVKCIFGKA